MLMDKKAKVYVSGHTGLLGTALLSLLGELGYGNLVCPPHDELDLTSQEQVNLFFAREKPEYVFHLAAKTGGVMENMRHPLDYLVQGSQIALNVLDAAFKNEVRGLVYAAAAQVYPDAAPQPIKEEAFMAGTLPPVMSGYAMAKILGVKFCECAARQGGARFMAAVLPGMYGLNDRGSTVLPMLTEKFAAAVVEDKPEIEIWGTGNARREFINSRDAAKALLFIMKNGEAGEYYNVGCGMDYSIAELADILQSISGYMGKLVFDPSKPEGAMRRLLDSGKINRLGWKAEIPFIEGLRKVYNEKLSNLRGGVC